MHFQGNKQYLILFEGPFTANDYIWPGAYCYLENKKSICRAVTVPPLKKTVKNGCVRKMNTAFISNPP
ncbi:MAG: hypothetical protein COA81_00175 [Alphaproteobacteria bacterium]|nr:MAG: hypothetical protein COA81_00175 [Alphaproteobacteria bacterium]